MSLFNGMADLTENPYFRMMVYYDNLMVEKKEVYRVYNISR